MQTILMIHAKCACMEYVLPEQKNGIFSILMEGSFYGTKENEILILENIKGAWYFTMSKEYVLKKNGNTCLDFSLQNGDIWKLTTKTGEHLSIIIVQISRQFPVFQKYILKNTCKITFGKNADNMICYDFLHLVSGLHGVVEKREDSIWIEDFSTNGIFSCGKRIYGKKKLDYGEEIILFGLHIVILEDILCVYGIKGITVSDQLIPWKGQISNKGEKWYREKEEFFHRSPRQIPICNREPISLSLPEMVKIEEREDKISKRRFYTFCSVWKKIRKTEQQKREEKELEKVYQREFSKIKERYQENVKILSNGYPSAEECCNYGRESVTLWNRNVRQEDFEFIRLGLGERPFDVKIHKQGGVSWLKRLNKELKILERLVKVPVGISLKEYHLWGIVGGKGKKGAYSVVYAMLAQMLASYCYTDVKIGIVYNEGNRQSQERWEFAKWFPHIWSGDGKQRYLAGNREETTELFYAWNQILKKTENIPRLILFLESADLLEEENQKKFLEFSQSGLTTFLLVENFWDLPNGCGHIIENTEEFQGVYHTDKGQEARQNIDFDKVSLNSLENFSRRLATIQVIGNRQEGELPEHLGFLEMYQAVSVDDLKISERWRRNATSQSMAVCIGKRADGNLCYLDVHEKKDGPHGLLAGTTGSGKSEVLLTYLLSLAVNYSPSEVAFVLIDFKGGGMANLLKEFPHVAGCISNLSGSQIERAMLAIKSENKRRQKLFAQYQINHISEYTYLHQHGQAAEEVPHLFLVVDEFAELKSQVPEFLQELIHVAQVGRSLGLHLILSTQKPSGTVDENIWSNSRFRLCLRVQRKEDSVEVLRRADASYLTGYGQGYLQVGGEESLVKFQAAYTGNPYQPQKERDAAILLTKNGSQELLGKSRAKEQENRETELEAITKYLCRKELQEEFGRTKHLWLPPLSEIVLLKDIVKKENNIRKTLSLRTIIGLCDAPSEQKQFPYNIDFGDKGNYAVLGSIQSGKTTLVETLLLGLIQKYNPKKLHFYILDYNSKRLSAFGSAKQAGGVVTAEEGDKLERFFNLLDEIVIERREMRKKEELPAILVVLDDMESFREQTKDMYLDRLYYLMRDSNSLGIYFLLTAGSFGLRGIPGHFREGIKECIALSFSDKAQYEDAFRRRIHILPEPKKGRGLVLVKGEPLELQVALPLKETEDYKRNKRVKEVAENFWKDWMEYLPKKIPSLPKKLNFWELDKNPAFQKLLENKNEILIGYDKVKAIPYFVTMEELDGYIISGKRKTGKKNLLILFSVLGKRKGMECIFFGKRHSILSEYGKWVDDFIEDEREWLACFSQIEEKRKKERFLLVEDMKDFFERIEVLGREERKKLFALILEGSSKGLHWIFAMNPSDYFILVQYDIFSTIVERERGIHLGGQLNEQKIFHFDNLSYREECASQPSGTGVAADRKNIQNGRTILCIEVT